MVWSAQAQSSALPGLLVLGQDQDGSYAKAAAQRQASDRAVQIAKTGTVNPQGLALAAALREDGGQAETNASCGV